MVSVLLLFPPMIMLFIKRLIAYAIYLASLIICSQNFEAVGETNFAINHDVSNSYSINFSVEPRYFLYRKNQLQLEAVQIDMVHFSTFKLNVNHSLSLGFQYRNRELFDAGDQEIRLTQQYNYKKQKLSFRYGHRFRSEQRLFDDFAIFRQRYRFAIDFPLDGERLDIGEAYIITSGESLLSISRLIKPEIDLRLTCHLGWQMSGDLKLQTGIEYRLEEFNIQSHHGLYILTAAVFKI